MNYEDLHERVVAGGLYERTYITYMVYAFWIVCGVVLSLYAITLTDNVFFQIGNAVFFTFVLVQAGMLGHDFSHRQVFKNPTYNKAVSAVIWGLFGGLSGRVWYEQHSAHHAHVNQQGLDPDIDIPFLFAKKQTLGTYALPTFFTRHQHILFFVTMPFWYSSKFIVTWRSRPEKITPSYFIEILLAAAHFGILSCILFWYLPFTVAVAFFATHILVAGVYLGMAFAPNHKGEEITSPDQKVTWLNQITSTRNLSSSRLSFFIFGGLNLQIEHHLFPGMSRFHYPKAQVIVKEFCLENGIRYHETTWFGSMQEIYSALKENRAK